MPSGLRTAGPIHNSSKHAPRVVSAKRSVDSDMCCRRLTLLASLLSTPSHAMGTLSNMRFRAPILSVTIIALACVLSVGMDRARQARETKRVSQWIELHTRWTTGSKESVPNESYWQWRAPPAAARLPHMASVNPHQVLSTGAGQEVWAINEAAYLGEAAIPTQAIPLLAVSTASFLGIALPDDPHPFSVLSQQIIGGLNPWHSLLKSRCDTCAPIGRDFPAPHAPRSDGPQGLDERSNTGISIEAERRRRSVRPFNHPPSPMAAVVINIRGGGLPTSDTMNTPGLAGIAALELAAQGRTDLAETFLRLGREGPSGTDQIAGYWAAHLVGANDPTLTAIKAQL